ncbi:hypothetical protein, partial [Intrasporangium oryzae]|uniref:hypothetical protein n=1 Tax=Intrasporangium oryzae TaxID=412687 RepID=UPI00055283CF
MTSSSSEARRLATLLALARVSMAASALLPEDDGPEFVYIDRAAVWTAVASSVSMGRTSFYRAVRDLAEDPDTNHLGAEVEVRRTSSKVPPRRALRVSTLVDDYTDELGLDPDDVVPVSLASEAIVPLALVVDTTPEVTEAR